MRIRPLIAPTILALAAVSSAQGVTIPGGEEGLKINLKGYLQLQMAMGASGEQPVPDGAVGNAAEESYDVLRGQAGESDPVAFNVRRARLAFEAKYGDGFKALFMIRGDENDDPRGQNSDRKIEIYRAYTAYGFEVGPIYHEVKIGLDFVFAGDSGPTAAYALPFERPALTGIAAAYGSSTVDGVTVNRYFDDRQTGIAYFASGGWFNVGVDIANGTSPDEIRDAASFGGASGYFIGGRLELAPSKEMMPSARNESFVGETGHHLVLGLDYGTDRDMHASQPADLTDGTPDDFTSYDYTFYGPDLCYHRDALTAVADLKFTRATQSGYTLDNLGNRSGDYSRTAKGLVWDMRAAWAIPLKGKLVIEPAAGFGIADYDRADKREGVAPARILSDDTNLDSGRTIDIGGTLYINKHMNKVQLAYRWWQGEEGAPGTHGKPSAQVLVFQHQLQF